MTFHNLQPGCCHPAHAMRTKCACGNVVNLSRAYGDHVVACKCGRKHRKNTEPRGSFARATGLNDGALSTGKRRGGRSGCPGI